MAATPLMSTTTLPVTVQRTQARAHLHLAHGESADATPTLRQGNGARGPGE